MTIKNISFFSLLLIMSYANLNAMKLSQQQKDLAHQLDLAEKNLQKIDTEVSKKINDLEYTFNDLRNFQIALAERDRLDSLLNKNIDALNQASCSPQQTRDSNSTK